METIIQPEKIHGVQKKSSERIKQELLGFVHYLPAASKLIGDAETTKKLASVIKHFVFTGEFIKEKLTDDDYRIALRLLRDYTHTMREHYPESRNIATQNEQPVIFLEKEVRIRERIKIKMRDIELLMSSFGHSSEQITETISMIERLFVPNDTNEDYETIHQFTLEIEEVIRQITDAQTALQITLIERNDHRTALEQAIADLHLADDKMLEFSKIFEASSWFYKILHGRTKDERRHAHHFNRISLTDKISELEKELQKDNKTISKQSTTLIQKLCKLHKTIVEAKKKPPRIFSKRESLFDKYDLDNLVAVHCDSYEPHLTEDGLRIESMMHKPASFLARNTIHFTINKVVETHFGGNWSDVPIVYALPMRGLLELNEAPAVFCYEDSYWAGDVKLPKGTVIWIKKGHYKINMSPKALENAKIIVVDNPVKSATDFVGSNNEPPQQINLNQEALDGLMPTDLQGRRPFGTDNKTVHYNSPLLKVEYSSIDAFDVLFSQHRQTSGTEKFTLQDAHSYFGISLRTMIMLDFFYGEKTTETQISEHGLSLERIRKENFSRIPLGGMLHLLDDNAQKVIEAFDNALNELIPFTRDALELQYRKESFINNLYAIAQLLAENESNVTNDIALESNYCKKLLQKARELKYPGWSEDSILSVESEKRQRDNTPSATAA